MGPYAKGPYDVAIIYSWYKISYMKCILIYSWSHVEQWYNDNPVHVRQSHRYCICNFLHAFIIQCRIFFWEKVIREHSELLFYQWSQGCTFNHILFGENCMSHAACGIGHIICGIYYTHLLLVCCVRVNMGNVSMLLESNSSINSLLEVL